MSEKKIKLKVNGIHCNGCVSKIKGSLDSLNSEIEAVVDVEAGIVKVSFDSERTGLSDIKSKITAVGFQVESVELE